MTLSFTMAIICTKCGDSIDADCEFVECQFICNNKFHSSCVKLTTAALRSAQRTSAAGSNLKWCCDDCCNTNIALFLRHFMDLSDKLDRFREEMVNVIKSTVADQFIVRLAESHNISSVSGVCEDTVSMTGVSTVSSNVLPVTDDDDTSHVISLNNRNIINNNIIPDCSKNSNRNNINNKINITRNVKRNLHTNVVAIDNLSNNTITNNNPDLEQIKVSTVDNSTSNILCGALSQRPTIIGTGVSVDSLQVVEPRKTMFVSRLHKDVSEQDVLSYLKDKFNVEDVSCRRIVPRLINEADRNFSSFRINVPISCVDSLLQPSSWPFGSLIKEFVNYPKKRKNNNYFPVLQPTLTNL